MAAPTELAAMRRAISLAALGLGTTSPNPPVGCVILDRHGVVVGEGFHERKGDAHAEAHALAMAGDRARGGTAVVTLEPCNHFGRTPPCRKLLIEAGIARCVIAIIDPTSREEGGAARMRAAGVDVEVGLLADEAELVLGPWLRALRTARPFVTWASLAEVEGGRSSLSDPFLDEMRVSVDAVLTEDGRVFEGVLGGHGLGMIELDGVASGGSPEELLASLHQGGIRSAVLNYSATKAAPFLAAGLVDQVLVYLPARTAGAGSVGYGPEEFIPARYGLREVRKTNGFVVIRAERA
ncbi:bifunctional diaminohydroxyphosphoribosylaminopyrimidine deaminase/5-amino-6-(5-phosphoribosylamino)uracil reductase RibD [Amycolatopsis thermalba]|uniref:diaminohydroxyphosphoribosylaminopyrimidine deaminase n=1 Tax=Amycolatopsis thermalba TaxID=944492 RepID=A0ABY4P1E5_9PSEU|nr:MULTISPECIES: bifunctional diaminohydroxyphosphoribosylaminopyrimidine deaminase/5-amino-6-(5-phosphoribosylamino)uracil reductase RibD [Amycolatopsis]UQS26072.1 bifunctional diaminohydroxyphosphoribosylaminopyrimidine deaminase/5-amino-6-(5-phosphoribosylamino)uracil reductase RibD [Amycolatopsis thermalba]